MKPYYVQGNLRKVAFRKITETEVEDYLCAEIAKLNGKAWKGNPYGQRGFCDRVCVLPNGVVCFVEVKRPGKRPRKNQQHKLNWKTNRGHLAVWVSSKGMIDKLICVLRRKIQTIKQLPAKHFCGRENCKYRTG